MDFSWVYPLRILLGCHKSSRFSSQLDFKEFCCFFFFLLVGCILLCTWVVPLLNLNKICTTLKKKCTSFIVHEALAITLAFSELLSFSWRHIVDVAGYLVLCICATAYKHVYAHQWRVKYFLTVGMVVILTVLLITTLYKLDD